MSIVHLRMVAMVLERRRARGEGLKCVDVVKGMSEVVVDAKYLILAVVVVVVDVLTGEVEVEVSGCLFVVIVMRIITRAEVEVRADMVEARSILSALLVWIGILLHSRNMLLLLLHLHPLQHQ
jgi:hypothetical protein